MKKELEKNEIIAEVRKIREKLLREADGNSSAIDKKGKAHAKKYGFKLSNKKPGELKKSTDAA